MGLFTYYKLVEEEAELKEFRQAIRHHFEYLKNTFIEITAKSMEYPRADFVSILNFCRRANLIDMQFSAKKLKALYDKMNKDTGLNRAQFIDLLIFIGNEKYFLSGN